ncbi:hypothetical protein Btru_014811 [Bulinus truncatus]|nr:hypothetical protein Btru_014811 [Bulinus truncatus]
MFYHLSALEHLQLHQLLSGQTKRDGSWGEWSDFHCPEDCHEKRLIKRRICDDPPPQGGGSYCPGSSYIFSNDTSCERTCPEDCPIGMWGPNCTYSCVHCLTDCDKKMGICARCKKGYHDPLKSCSKECGQFTFGLECQGNCLKECDGVDCIDRANGICPKKTHLWWLMYFLMLLLIPVAVLVYIRYQQTNAINAALLEEKVNVMLYKSGVFMVSPSSSGLCPFPSGNTRSVAVNTDDVDFVRHSSHEFNIK